MQTPHLIAAVALTLLACGASTPAPRPSQESRQKESARSWAPPTFYAKRSGRLELAAHSSPRARIRSMDGSENGSTFIALDGESHGFAVRVSKDAKVEKSLRVEGRVQSLVVLRSGNVLMTTGVRGAKANEERIRFLLLTPDLVPLRTDEPASFAECSLVEILQGARLADGSLLLRSSCARRGATVQRAWLEERTLSWTLAESVPFSNATVASDGSTWQAHVAHDAPIALTVQRTPSLRAQQLNEPVDQEPVGFRRPHATVSQNQLSAYFFETPTPLGIGQRAVLYRTEEQAGQTFHRASIAQFFPHAPHHEVPLFDAVGPVATLFGSMPQRASDGTLAIPLSYTIEAKVEGMRLPVPSDVDLPQLETLTALAIVRPEALRPEHVLVLPPPVSIRSATKDLHELSPTVLASSERDWMVGRGNVVEFFSRSEHLALPGTVEALPPPAVAQLPAPTVTVRAPLRPSWSMLCNKKDYPCTLDVFLKRSDGSRVLAGAYYKGSGSMGGVPFAAKAYQNALLASFRPDGTTAFVKTMGASWHNSIAEGLLLSDGRLVVYGVHGNFFNPGKGALPPRDGGKAVDLNIGYVAIYTPDGELAFARDVDELGYGGASDDPLRTCYSHLVSLGGLDWGITSRRCPGPTFFHMRGSELVRVHEGALSFGPQRGTVQSYSRAPESEASITLRPLSLLHTERTTTHEWTHAFLAPSLGYTFAPELGTYTGMKRSDGSATLVSAVRETPLATKLLPQGEFVKQFVARILLTDVNAAHVPAQQLEIGRGPSGVYVHKVEQDPAGRTLVLLSLESQVRLGPFAIDPPQEPGHSPRETLLLSVSKDRRRVDVFPLRQEDGKVLYVSSEFSFPSVSRDASSQGSSVLVSSGAHAAEYVLPDR